MSEQIELEAKSAFFHDVLEEWLQDPDVTIACGRWSDGAISEFIPARKAELLPSRYNDCFAGVRELRLQNEPHHLHIDLGRIHQACYTVAPSVCLNFRPSFEIRFLTLGPGGAPTDRWSVALMLTNPYDSNGLRRPQVERFFERANAHARMQPDLVGIQIEPDVRNGADSGDLLSALQSAASSADTDWDKLIESVKPGARCRQGSEVALPRALPVIERAMLLPDASLVIYRDRTLIEFKTEKLAGVYRYEEHGHVSWQIGHIDDHHCHLSLSAVERVLFSAEPVPCQGGGLNYTIWFLTSGSSGNPWRRDGYFSVTLNRPYEGNSPRLDVIEPLLDLYRGFMHESWVEADEAFRNVVDHGVPGRDLSTRPQ
ncbi:MAG: hypothetical protein ACO1NY_07785 [Pseudorhodoplanes sp.]